MIVAGPEIVLYHIQGDPSGREYQKFQLSGPQLTLHSISTASGSDVVNTKSEIVKNWLPRYTGRPLAEFGKFILLSNFVSYVEIFADRFGVEVLGRSHPMQSATANDLTILNFGMGSAMAATVMDLLAAIEPKAVLFLGKCGGLKKTKVGDFILPIAAIRGEGTSNDYMPPEIPALPSFRLQKAVSAMIVKQGLDYWTGTVYTTNRRVWEHDEKFKDYLTTIRASAIDMETATIFIVGFVNHIPKGRTLAGLRQPDDARRGQDQPQRQVRQRSLRARNISKSASIH